MKALLITLAVLFAGALMLAGVGYYFWQQYGNELMADIESGVREGKEYARVANDRDCYYRMLSRLNECTTMSCTVKTKLFTEHCLRNTREITDLCDTVPDITSFLAYGRWSAEVCAREAPDNAGCDTVLQEVSKHCMIVGIKNNAQQPDKSQTRPIE